MNFIIIGDKYQRGMKSKGCPGLIKLDNNSNIFQHQYSVIKKNFIKSQIIYIGGFESKKIESFLAKNYSDVIFINNKEYDNYSDSYSISLVDSFLNQNTFIIFGYTILHKKIFDKFNPENGSQIFVSQSPESQIGCVINHNRIDYLSFDLPNHIEDIFYITYKDTKYLQSLLSNLQYRNYFIFELFNKLIDNGVVIKPFFIKLPKNNIYEYTK